MEANHIYVNPHVIRPALLRARLLIYLETDVQKKLAPPVSHSLNPSGFLFLGPSENVATVANASRRRSKRTDLSTETHLAAHCWPCRSLIVAGSQGLCPAGPVQMPMAKSKVSPVRSNGLSWKITRRQHHHQRARRYCVLPGRTGNILSRGWLSLEQASGTRKKNRSRPEPETVIHRALKERKEVVRQNIRYLWREGSGILNLIVDTAGSRKKDSDCSCRFPGGHPRRQQTPAWWRLLQGEASDAVVAAARIMSCASRGKIFRRPSRN